MAGTILLTDDDTWSVASWAFYWVLDTLVEHVADDELVRQLREIEQENIGMLGLHDFAPEQQQRILDFLRNDIVPEAERNLLPDDPNRERAIDVIRELATMARATTD